MKQFYSRQLSLRTRRIFLLSWVLLVMSYVSNSQVYTASLSGPAEAPPNSSPGTGNATVTITGTNMRVQASFTGLMGNTTAAHIHAPTAVAGTGTAGVATALPSFPGFPLGVTSGTMDMTYDMTLLSSYNPAYVAANGGTAASAFNALKTALNNGTSYFNIHTTSFLGGEIRGFLLLCPTITVTIPNAMALPQGVLPNTVYPAYAPAASLTLQANVSGGTGPYTYSWSTGATTSSITVSPTVTTQYTVTVLDQNRCPGMATKTVNVMDISGGNKGDKIMVCHMGHNTLTIAGPGVAAHLGHGDVLGSCTIVARPIRPGETATEELTPVLSIQARMNPSPGYFDLQINGKAGSEMQVRVYDMTGRIIETRSSLQASQTIRLGAFYQPGIYMVEVLQGTEKQILKLVKSN